MDTWSHTRLVSSQHRPLRATQHLETARLQPRTFTVPGCLLSAVWSKQASAAQRSEAACPKPHCRRRCQTAAQDARRTAGPTGPGRMLPSIQGQPAQGPWGGHGGRSQRGRGRRGRYFSAPGERPQATGPAAHTPPFQERLRPACPSTSSSEAPRGPDVSQGVLRRTPWEEPDPGAAFRHQQAPSGLPRLGPPLPTAVREAWSRGAPAAVSLPAGRCDSTSMGDRGSLDPLDQRRRQEAGSELGRVGTSPTSGAGLMGGNWDRALSPVLDPWPRELPPGGHTKGAPRSSRAQEGWSISSGPRWGLNTQCNSQERSGAPSPHQAPLDPARTC